MSENFSGYHENNPEEMLVGEVESEESVPPQHNSWLKRHLGVLQKGVMVASLVNAGVTLRDMQESFIVANEIEVASNKKDNKTVHMLKEEKDSLDIKSISHLLTAVGLLCMMPAVRNKRNKSA